MNNTKNNILDLLNWLAISDNLEQSDLIFLFGGAILEIPEKGFELYKKSYALEIIVTGDNGTFGNPEWNKPSANIYFDFLIEKGVPRENLVIQNKSTNTLEDVLLALPIINEKQIKIDKVILVSRPVHQRRAFATFAKYFPETKIINSPCKEKYANSLNNDELQNLKIRCIQEYERLIKYAKKGDILKQEIPPEIEQSYACLKKKSQ